MAFIPKPPVEKIPLAIRKEIRDKYESKKGDYEAQIVRILGYPVALNINPSAVWAYGETVDPASAGYAFSGYVDGLIFALKDFVETYGDFGKDYFKQVVTKSEVSLAVNELGDSADIINADVKDGVFRILFKQDRLGSNQSLLSNYLAAALNDAPHQGLSLQALHSIKSIYEPEIGSVQKKIAALLAMPDIVLDPNFEETYAALLKKDTKDWQQSFGNALLKYFQGVGYQLGELGFNNDSMLQEGFAEAITKKTIKFRIVETLKNNNDYNEAAVEDGVLYIQTTVPKWFYNTDNAGTGIVDLL